MVKRFFRHAALAWIAFFLGVVLINLITPADTLRSVLAGSFAAFLSSAACRA